MELQDPYDHEDPALVYIQENIPTPATEDKFNEQFVNGCTCQDFCTVENKCMCLIRSGASYSKSVAAKSIQSAYVINVTDPNKPIYECNDNCNCYGTACGNRLVQFGPSAYLNVILCDQMEDTSGTNLRKKGTKGLGLIITENIQRGSFICEYAGEVISKEEALKRHETNEQHCLMNFIFCINEHFGGNNVDTYIDPSKFGNIGRYINHSCQPNCELLPIRINNTVPKLCIFACQDIGKHSELTFDYGSDSFTATDLSADKRVKCLCNTVNCRKYMPYTNYVK